MTFCVPLPTILNRTFSVVLAPVLKLLENNVKSVEDPPGGIARKFGATIGINARSEDPVERVRELMGGEPTSGVDFAFDAIGSGRTMEQILHMARARRPGERDGGIAVLVGVPHGETPTLPMFMLFGGKLYRGGDRRLAT